MKMRQDSSTKEEKIRLLAYTVSFLLRCGRHIQRLGILRHTEIEHRIVSVQLYVGIDGANDSRVLPGIIDDFSASIWEWGVSYQIVFRIIHLDGRMPVFGERGAVNREIILIIHDFCPRRQVVTGGRIGFLHEPVFQSFSRFKRI